MLLIQQVFDPIFIIMEIYMQSIFLISFFSVLMLMGCASNSDEIQIYIKNSLDRLDYSTSSNQANELRLKAIDILKNSDRQSLMTPEVYNFFYHKQSDEEISILIHWISYAPSATHIKLAQNNRTLLIKIPEEANQYNNELFNSENLLLFDAPVIVEKDEFYDVFTHRKKPLYIYLLNDKLEVISNRFAFFGEYVSSINR